MNNGDEDDKGVEGVKGKQAVETEERENNGSEFGKRNEKPNLNARAAAL